MNVLNSLPLWGGLAALGVSIPVLVHLLNKSRPKKIPWAAMELLHRTSQQRARNIKLEDLFIMLLRCVALLLAAFAMMRVVFTNDGTFFSGAPRELIIAIDGSFSMNHGQFQSRFDLAKKHAFEAVKSLPSGSKFSMVVMGGEPDVIFRHSDPDLDTLEQRLDSLKAHPVALSLDNALSAVESLLDESDLANKEVQFLTDGQKQTWESLSLATLDHFAELQKMAAISVVPLSDGSFENLSVSALHVVSGVRRVGGFVSLSAMVTNHGQRPASTSLRLDHGDQNIEVQTVGPVESGESQLVRLSAQLDSSGSNRFKVSISPDNLAEDNIAYLAIEVPEKLKVLIIEGKDREARYLELGLQLQRSGYSRGLNHATFPSTSVRTQDIESADIIVLANVGDLSEDNLESLVESVRAGSGLMVYAGDQMDEFAAERILGQLMPLSFEATINPDSGQSHQLQVSAQPHRISRELSRLEAELSDCIVKGYHQLDPGPQANVLLGLSNGKPLLLTQPAGKGHVAFFATGPSRNWSNLPLNPAGPILLHLLIDELSAIGIPRAFEVGEFMDLDVPSSSLGAELKLLHPGGQISVPRRTSRPTEEGGVRLSLGASVEPGFYGLDLGGNSDVEVLAVNVDSNESDIELASVDDLKSVLQGTGVRVAVKEEMVDDTQQQTLLGSYLALAALLLMIAQGAFATELTRRKQQRTSPIRTGYGVGVNTD